MADTAKTICNLQAIVTALSQQADGHVIEAKLLGSCGFTKLEEKYLEHAEEERGYVSQCIDRIIDLGGEVKLEAKEAGFVTKNPVEWIKYDLKVSVEGLKALKDMLKDACGDVTTYDILKDYYKDEEEDMYWGEQQLELIECIGLQNWLVLQL